MRRLIPWLLFFCIISPICAGVYSHFRYQPRCTIDKSEYILDLSTDGALLLTSDLDGRGSQLHAWDTHTGRLVFQWTSERFFSLGTRSKDHRYHADFSGGGPVRLFEWQSGQFWTFDEANNVDQQLEFSADNRFLLARSKFGETVTVIDVDRRKLATRAAAQKAFMSNEGGLLLTQKKPKDPVVVWDLLENKKVGALPVSTDHWIASPDGQLLVEWSFAMPNDEGKLDVWDVRAGKRRFHRASRNAELLRASFSPDSRRLAIWSLGFESEMEVIDTATGKQLWAELKTTFNCLFSPDNAVLLDTHPGAPTCDANTGECLWKGAEWKFSLFVPDSAMAIYRNAGEYHSSTRALAK